MPSTLTPPHWISSGRIVDGRPLSRNRFMAGSTKWAYKLPFQEAKPGTVRTSGWAASHSYQRAQSPPSCSPEMASMAAPTSALGADAGKRSSSKNGAR
jgi:hypothetical protein